MQKLPYTQKSKPFQYYLEKVLPRQLEGSGLDLAKIQNELIADNDLADDSPFLFSDLKYIWEYLLDNYYDELGSGDVGADWDGIEETYYEIITNSITF